MSVADIPFVIIPLLEENGSEGFYNYLVENIKYPSAKVFKDFKFDIEECRKIREGILESNKRAKSIFLIPVVQYNEATYRQIVELNNDLTDVFKTPEIKLLPIIVSEEIPNIEENAFPSILISDSIVNGKNLSQTEFRLLVLYLIEFIPYLIREYRGSLYNFTPFLSLGIYGGLIFSESFKVKFQSLLSRIEKKQTEISKLKSIEMEYFTRLPENLKDETKIHVDVKIDYSDRFKFLKTCDGFLETNKEEFIKVDREVLLKYKESIQDDIDRKLNLEEILNKYLTVVKERINNKLFLETERDLKTKEFTSGEISKSLKPLSKKLNTHKKSKEESLEDKINKESNDFSSFCVGCQNDLKEKYSYLKKYTNLKIFSIIGLILFLIPALFLIRLFGSFTLVAFWGLLVVSILSGFRLFLKNHLWKNFISHWNYLKNKISDNYRKQMEEIKNVFEDSIKQYLKNEAIDLLKDQTIEISNKIENINNFWSSLSKKNLDLSKSMYFEKIEADLGTLDDLEEWERTILEYIYTGLPEKNVEEIKIEDMFIYLRNTVFENKTIKLKDNLNKVITDWEEKVCSEYCFFGNAASDPDVSLIFPENFETRKIAGKKMFNWHRNDVLLLVNIFKVQK